MKMNLKKALLPAALTAALLAGSASVQTQETQDVTMAFCTWTGYAPMFIAQEMGYRKIITYIPDTENGSSLKASGWHLEGVIRGHTWDTPSRPRQLYIEQLSLFDDEPKQKYPIGNKQRWAKDL